MKLELAAVAVSLLLVGPGAAMATPGNAPTDAQADEHAQAADNSEAEAATETADGASYRIPLPRTTM